MPASRAGPANAPSRVGRGPAALIVATLAGLAIVFIALALRRPLPPTFAPTPAAAADSAGAWRLTVDASNSAAWRFIELRTGTAVHHDQPWDLAFRRFHVITNGGSGFTGHGGAIDLGIGSIDTIFALPERRFEATTADSVHPVLDDWYRYGMTTHLLTPRGRVYGIRTADGGAAVLEFLGYYCPGPAPGCVTIRYRPLADAPVQ